MAKQKQAAAMTAARMHLLSGGVDSTVMLYEFRDRIARCVSFDYGQAHVKELRWAALHAAAVGIQLEVVAVPQLRGSTLTDGAGGFVVPNRNAVLLNIAANMAAAAGLSAVSFACTLDDAEDFPDCTPYFVDSLNECLAAADIPVQILAPYLNLTKRRVAETGRILGVDLSQTWSCYAGGAVPCGVCKACFARVQALR